MSTSLLTLLDDIASVLDDVALATKLATKKTAGVLGDDLALNAEQVSGTSPDRELPVVWAVAKGSALNKVILVPAALLMSTFLPWLVTPLMVLGGAFLCFEGVEKLVHAAARRSKAAGGAEPVPVYSGTEPERIRGAVRTDFILSAEIVVISLGAVADAPFAVKAATLSAISVLATVGIYGLVAGIVKLDDLGLYWRNARSSVLRLASRALIRCAPLLMRSLSVIGIIAVFLVGGGIIAHSVDRFKRWSSALEARVSELDGVGSALGALASPLFDGLVGLAVGAVSVLLVSGGRRAFAALRAQ